MHLASRLPALDHIIQTVLHPVDKKKKKKSRATSRFCRVQSVPETTRIFSLSPVLWTTFIRLRKEEWKQTQKNKKIEMFQMILIFVLHALNIHSRLSVHRSRHVITAPFFLFPFFLSSLLPNAFAKILSVPSVLYSSVGGNKSRDQPVVEYHTATHTRTQTPWPWNFWISAGGNSRPRRVQSSSCCYKSSTVSQWAVCAHTRNNGFRIVKDLF